MQAAPASLASHRARREEIYNLFWQEQEEMMRPILAAMPATARAELEAFMNMQRLEQEQLTLQQEMEIREVAAWEAANLQPNQPSQLGMAAMAHDGPHVDDFGERREEAMNPVVQNAQGEVSDSWEDGPTTVLVRQIPRRYTQQQFMAMLQCGFGGLFDFLYLPWDVDGNMGYGYVNFHRPEHALLFYKDFDGLEVAGRRLRVHPAQLQGFEANYQHFAAKIGHDPAYSPIIRPRASRIWDI